MHTWSSAGILSHTHTCVPLHIHNTSSFFGGTCKKDDVDVGPDADTWEEVEIDRGRGRGRGGG